MKFVCPLPRVWIQIYDGCLDHWLATGRDGPPPPRPPLLALWSFSNDFDKKQTWEASINWARERGLEDLIPEIIEDQSYMVAELSTEILGNLGVPE